MDVYRAKYNTDSNEVAESKMTKDEKILVLQSQVERLLEIVEKYKHMFEQVNSMNE